MKNKYYWLKLQQTFFEKEEIKVLESTPNGSKYVVFYLKLLTKSISAEGKLMFRNIIPYTPEMLSQVTNTDIDTVVVAIDLFEKLGLLEKLDDGALFMSEIKNMIGEETEWAKKKREYRERKKLEGKKDNVLKLSSNCPNDVRQKKELEKEKELEKDNNYNNSFSETFKYLERCGFRLTPIQIEQLQEDIKYFSKEWVKDAAKEASNRGKINYSYLKGILDNWSSDGRGNKNGSIRKDNESSTKKSRFTKDFNQV